MKTFKVIYQEVLMHEFYIEAETESEVDAKFVEMANDGELDFSNGEVESSEITNVVEVK